MKSISRQLLAATLLLLSSTAVIAYSDSRDSLERSRNSLLDREDNQRRSYDDVCSRIDQFNKTLDQLNAQKRNLEDDMAKTDSALKDIECNLRNAN
jgi:septal ring factor EnvC (AmiA/AmiB activator)